MTEEARHAVMAGFVEFNQLNEVIYAERGNSVVKRVLLFFAFKQK